MPDSWRQYVGAGWGQFDLHLHNFNDVGTAVTDITHSHANAWKAFVGVRFAPFIAVEAAHHPLDPGRHPRRACCGRPPR